MWIEMKCVKWMCFYELIMWNFMKRYYIVDENEVFFFRENSCLIFIGFVLLLVKYFWDICLEKLFRDIFLIFV